MTSSASTQAMESPGISWLEEIPEHWKILPNRSNFVEIIDLEHPDAPMLSVTINDGVVPQSTLLNNSARKDTSKIEKAMYKLVLPGDIVYNKMRAWQGAIGMSKYYGIVSAAYIVQRPKPQVYSPYFENLFRTPMFSKEAERWSYGIASDMWSLRPEHFKMIYSCVPPFEEQKEIVKYLDYTDPILRGGVFSKQRLVELMEEYKRAVIQQAVTRGLDPDVSLKPSGVEWLGDIPEHWEASQVKRHYSIQLGKMLQNTASEPLDTEVAYLKAQHVQWFAVNTDDPPTMWASPRDIVQFGICSGDLLVCEGGEGGRAGLIKDIAPGHIIQNALHRVRPLSDSKNEYLQYVMSAIADIGWFEAINNKATIAHFTAEKFGALVIPIPPPLEQTAIVAHLDKLTSDIDAAIAHTRREIELLEEYRTRLIADVVTGKLDVREAASNLPDVNLDDLQPLVEGGEADD